jgi:hypothetical protein
LTGQRNKAALNNVIACSRLLLVRESFVMPKLVVVDPTDWIA